MGLNLTERSSGTYQGKLNNSQRGQPRARKWLYFAARRPVNQPREAEWDQAKKDARGREAKRAVVGVMRKLVLALHKVAVSGVDFEAGKLFPGSVLRAGAARAVPSDGKRSPAGAGPGR